MTTGHQPGTCSWCGLPVAASWSFTRPSATRPSATGTSAVGASAVGASAVGASAVGASSQDVDAASESASLSDDEFCCFGCRFAAQVTQDRGESGQVQWTLTRLGIAIFFTMNVMVFTMALWSQDVYNVDQSQSLVASISELFKWLCFVSATPVLFLLGIPIAVAACAELSRGRITTDLLVMVGVVAAFAYSVASLLQGSGHIYFEVASMVLVLITLGRWLEASGKLHTGELLESLERVIPETSRLLVETGEVSTPTSALKPGDRVLVLAGERIPADGVIESGRATNEHSNDELAAPLHSVEIDQQILTGESTPVTLHSGEAVLSGTVPSDSSIVIRVTRCAQEGTLAKILEVVRHARSERGRFQKAADAAAAWFVPFVAVVAATSFVCNVLVGSVADGLLASLAVTLIACPCALGLATSVAVWTAMRTAAEHGVLFRNGEVLERLSSIKAVRFDKTGTLTTGQPCVARLVCREEAEQKRVSRIAELMSRESTHSFSRAINRFVSEASDPEELLDSEFDLEPGSIRTLSGFGLEATLENSPDGDSDTKVWLGSRRFLESRNCELSPVLREFVEAAASRANPVVLIGWDGQVQGVFSLHEDIREEASATVDTCRELGLDPGILSGDLAVHAAKLGNKLGIPAIGELLPEEKLRALQTVQQSVGPVLMVGDGINDSPALAGADVAASLGSGADLSRDAAGVCLLRDDLSCVPWMLALSRQTRQVIRQNLFWAFGYNTVGMALAATGMLNPVLAAAVMFGSSAFVLWNSRRLSGFELPAGKEHTGMASRDILIEQPLDSVGEVLNA